MHDMMTFQPTNTFLEREGEQTAANFLHQCAQLTKFYAIPSEFYGVEQMEDDDEKMKKSRKSEIEFIKRAS